MMALAVGFLEVIELELGANAKAVKLAIALER